MSKLHSFHLQGIVCCTGNYHIIFFSFALAVESVMGLQQCPCPNSRNLSPYMAEGTSQMWLSSGFWEVEIILDSLNGPNRITSVRKRQEGQSQRRCDDGNKVRGRFEDTQLLALRNAGSCWRLQKSRKWTLLRKLPEGTQPCDTLIWRLLTSRIIR